MFFLHRPSDAAIRRALDAQRDQPFTYPEVGATREGLPAGYPLNRHRGPLGQGAVIYERARAAIRRWAMYDLDWTVVCWPDVPIEPGRTVGILVRNFGVWSLNPCRIVYTLDESGPIDRFGFAFGTLPAHSEQGEERFTVELHPNDDSVWFEISTFARGYHPAVRVAYPLMRYVQRRFGRESVRAMQRAVQGTAEEDGDRPRAAGGLS